jgi:ABC-type multidrug transport system ATPase subunit
LCVQGLGFAYPGQPPLFDSLSFGLPSGVSVLDGEIGSGKTTLLKLLAGDLTGRGECRLGGLRQSDDAAAWRQAVCFFDPRDAAYDALTPAALRDLLQQRHPALDAGAWQRHADAFGLQPHQGKPLAALSTGSRRKAALAVALSAGAALTLLDEPGAGLDAASLRHLAQALRVAAGWRGRALLLASSLPLELPQSAARVLLPA